jgi:uncharacterized protein (UPF0335 family)
MDVVTKQTKEDLKGFVDRLEFLEKEKAKVVEDMKHVFQSAKNTGFDIKILRKILRARKEDLNKMAEEQSLFDIYAEALGMGIKLDDRQISKEGI